MRDDARFLLRIGEAPFGPAASRERGGAAKFTGNAIALRILIVDDESYAADALGSLLRGRGYEAVVAHDGASGIAAGVAGRFDAAVIDLGLGTVDGYEVARALRARHGVLVRLIAYTGFAGASVQRRARANGFDCVLVKPAMIDSIVAAIEGKNPDARASTSGGVETGSRSSRTKPP